MIELASFKDRADVERLAKQVHAMHVAWRPDLYRMPEELFPEELFSGLIARRELYVAKLGGAVAGYAQVTMRSVDSPEQQKRKILLINQFCVDEPLRSQGIGTRMVQELRILAKAFGCTDMMLSVYPQNDEAVSFYQKCGFMIQNINMQTKL